MQIKEKKKKSKKGGKMKRKGEEWGTSHPPRLTTLGKEYSALVKECWDNEVRVNI